MPKDLFVDPQAERAPGTIHTPDIPMNQYHATPQEELEAHGRDAMVRIYRDMLYIRAFETMLNDIKRTGEYQGLAVKYGGPAHLSIGQEAAAVGQALHLGVEDFIFGSHRSHGELLAKGLSAIEKLDDAALQSIMEHAREGRILKVVEGLEFASVKERAHAFLLYGAMAEIFARETGFNRGLGGSMHTFFIPFGIYPNNAIVGGSATIAAGAALYKRVNAKSGIVVANIGDGSLGCGPVWEAFNFAAMDQYHTLWDAAHRGGLPVLFNIFNNHYGMGGQTTGETMAYAQPARVGAGISPTALHAERVDGCNPLAVAEAYARKRAVLEAGEGPALLEVNTYRFSGHSPSDASSYRSEAEMEAWQALDPLTTYPEKLIGLGLVTAEEAAQMERQAQELMLALCRLANDEAISPYMDLQREPDAIARYMFSNTQQPALDGRTPEALMPMEDNPRVQAIAKKERFGLTPQGQKVSKNRAYQLRDGIFEAMIEGFYTDPTLIAYGEENRDWGGAFAVYRGLTEALPYHRLFNSPISEAAIVGSAVGYAMCGGRAVVELMYCDFIGRAGDEIFNQLAKWQAMSSGELKMPVVLRLSVGSKYGAQHSQDWSALVAHMPGLKAVFPATPYDAKGLMASALAGCDPVCFFESQRDYDVGELFHEGGVPKEHYEIPLGAPDIKRRGEDITILTIGSTLYRALEAADILQERYGLSAEVIDARSIVPFDYAPVVESVRKTGRLLLASDACERGSHLKELSANLTELCFDFLDAPPVVVASRNWITPAGELEDWFFPQASTILDAIHARLLPLPGHTPRRAFTDAERLQNERKGI